MSAATYHARRVAALPSTSLFIIASRMAFIEEVEPSSPKITEKPAENKQEDTDSFFSNLLKPGSSLSPTFLAILDGAFVFLFLIFVALAWITNGNLHIFILMAVEGCLWASVKWFVSEVKKAQGAVQNSEEKTKKDQ